MTDQRVFEIAAEPLRRLGHYLARSEKPELLELYRTKAGRTVAYLGGVDLELAVLAECCIDLSGYEWFQGRVWISRDVDGVVAYERPCIDFLLVVLPPGGGTRTPST